MIKKKPCDGCKRVLPIWKNSGGKKYCRQCWSAHSVLTSPKPTVRQKPLSPRSLKRTKEERIYSGKRIIFLNKYPVCQAHITGICTHHSTDVHHKAGRTGELYLDNEFWMAVCRPCHMWIETHPKEAREKGFSVSKINPKNTL